jgi:hypothetical protein
MIGGCRSIYEVGSVEFRKSARCVRWLCDEAHISSSPIVERMLNVMRQVRESKGLPKHSTPTSTLLFSINHCPAKSSCEGTLSAPATARTQVFPTPSRCHTSIYRIVRRGNELLPSGRRLIRLWRVLQRYDRRKWQHSESSQLQRQHERRQQHARFRQWK